jgi:hypothetical protein
MRLLVVTRCTLSKAAKPANELSLEDFASPDRRRKRERELEAYRLPALRMYRGEHHIHAMKGGCVESGMPVELIL